MDRRPPRVTVLPDDEFPPGRRRGRRGPGWALPVAVLAGLAAGIAAVFFVVQAVRGSGDEPAPAAAPPPPPAETATVTVGIIFPEGFTAKQMAARVGTVAAQAREAGKDTPLREADYLRAAKDLELVPAQFVRGGRRPDRLEGFLFPRRYDFPAATTATELVELQVTEFLENWRTLDLAESRRLKLTPYQVLIIASMVEKEVRVPKERALVAAVIVNRLKEGMPLGIDATLRYGLEIPNTEAIKQSQLNSDNPYNTARRKGLPPTPIANPGLPSLQAAAKPAKVDHLYFARTKDCRTHFFTDSLDEFEAFLDGPDSFRQGPKSCA